MRHQLHRHLRLSIVLLALVCAAGCVAPGGIGSDGGPISNALRVVNLSDPVQPTVTGGPVLLAGARNEFVSFAIEINGLPVGQSRRRHPVIRFTDFRSTSGRGTIDARQITAAQVLPVSVDLDHAEFVRQSGLTTNIASIPRVLLPIEVNNQRLSVSTLRPPTPEQPITLWFDLQVPDDAPAGTYRGAVELAADDEARAVTTLDVELVIHDFALPTVRHTEIIAHAAWDRLVAFDSRNFSAVTPTLLSRTDGPNRGAVEVLDALVRLAAEHRVNFAVPRLQPLVKWKPYPNPPEVDWREFDAVVGPWLNGERALGYWPLPTPDYLDQYDLRSQLAYWTMAATHFEANEWMARARAVVGNVSRTGRVSSGESIEISVDAARMLWAHPRMQVLVPLEDDQVQFRRASNVLLVEPANASRINVAVPGLVHAPPIQSWPSDAAPPQRYVRMDGTISNERDVRAIAWLAFLRQAKLLVCADPLPRQEFASEPSLPSDFTWFYPGSWFGVKEPLPTIQLKWLRKAQQDLAYLHLATERGEAMNARLLARLMIRQVQVHPAQAPDITYSLLSGTSEAQSWSDAQGLLARMITSGQGKQERSLSYELSRWADSQQRPLLVPRRVEWLWDTLPDSAGSNWIDARVGIDLYSPADEQPANNMMQWTTPAPGFFVRPQPLSVIPLKPNQVRRVVMAARVDLDKPSPLPHRPLKVTFTHGFNSQQAPVEFMLPVATSDRREGQAPAIDGSLADWREVDAIQNGPLVKMLDRRSVQRQQLEYLKNPATIYANWGEQDLYLAFRVEGAAQPSVFGARNWVNYEARRAWGEDLCEVLVQPVYADNTLGSQLHLVFKPSGAVWPERRLDRRTNADTWAPLDGLAIRYAPTIHNGVWRGEAAIPWKAIHDSEHGRPVLLRFNLSQHIAATGESGSWAGPVDFGRDENFMGLLRIGELKDPNLPTIGARR